MGESYAPASAREGAIEPMPPRIELGELGMLRIELGVLRNGLGSIRNLELLLKSIKVGQKGLFAAVSAVHADCGAMIADAAALAGALSEAGGDAGCAERLSDALSTSVRELESVLAATVASGRLSVAQRLKLERDLSRCARELGSALPLVSLFERICRPPPLELTPLELVHASSAERSEQKSVVVSRAPAPSAAGCSVSVDLEAAKTLVAIAVALVTDGGCEGSPRLAFERRSGGAPVSIISVGPPRVRPPAASEPSAAGGSASVSVAPASVAPASVAPGDVQIAALRLSASSLLCAEVAARRLGGRFEYAREARRVCIYWPLS